MEEHGYKFLIFMSSISIIGAVPSFYSEIYNGYTLIMPLTDGDTRIPLNLNSSFAKQWCSRIDSSLPRITDEIDQRNLVQFIRNATRKYQSVGIENIFVNNINHTLYNNWTWVNGQPNLDSISVISAVTPFYSETYNGSTLIMPLTEGDTRAPLTLNSSFAEQWCSSINSSFARIIDESDQRNIIQLIRNAVRKYQLTGMENIFVNNIKHTLNNNWTWVNGEANQGFTVKQVSNGADGYFFGYLWTNDYRVSEGRPFEPRRYICETSAQSTNSSHCEMKLGNRCYWKKDVMLTWYKARQACFKEGGDLASFELHNEANLRISLKDLGLIAGTSYWTGISKSVWRWNDKDRGSEIKYSNWKANHPSNYSAKCLCLNKQPNYDYEWIECDCDKSYPFICKRNGPLEHPPFNWTFSETLTRSRLPVPMNDLRETSVISEILLRFLMLSFHALIFVAIVILISAAVIMKKQKKRPVNPSRDVTLEAKTTIKTDEPSDYEEVEEVETYLDMQKRGENKSSTNCSASGTTPVNPSRDDVTLEAKTTVKTEEPEDYEEVEEVETYLDMQKRCENQSSTNCSASRTTYATVVRTGSKSKSRVAYVTVENGSNSNTSCDGVQSDPYTLTFEDAQPKHVVDSEEYLTIFG